jgi:hypothetical protein
MRVVSLDRPLKSHFFLFTFEYLKGSEPLHTIMNPTSRLFGSRFWERLYFFVVKNGCKNSLMHLFSISIQSYNEYNGSGMFIPVPDPWSKNSNKREGWKKICCHFFFFYPQISLNKIIFIFEMQRKNWASFQRISDKFLGKKLNKLSKIWVWGPRSRIRKKPIPDPGSRGKKGTGSRIQHCIQLL